MTAAERKRRGAAARTARWTLLGLGAIVVTAVLAVLVVAGTPWGRERVRVLVLDQLEGVVDGQVEIGRLEGNLLLNPRARDVAIVDADGRPFVEAASLAWRISIPSLLRQRIVISGLELEGARVVLDRPPGEDWNFSRIFRTDPDPDPDPEPGWGDWVELRDIRLAATEVVLRMEWAPDEDLAPAEREERVRAALAGEMRERVREVPGGYQEVMEFRQIDASIPSILAAHPDTSDIPIEIERFAAVLEVFEAPAPGIVDNLSGVIRIGGEGLRLRNLRLSLPASDLTADADLQFEGPDILARVDAAPVTSTDLRFLYPALPETVHGDVRGVLRVADDSVRIGAQELDLHAGEGRVQGRFDLTLGDFVRLDGAELSFERVTTDLIESLAPELDFAVSGELGGHVVAIGQGNESEAVRLDALVRFDDHAGGTSRVSVDGVVEAGEVPRLHSVIVSVDPLRADLIAAFAPAVPPRGYLEGFAMLDGPLTGPLRFDSDLTHHDPIAGTGRLLARGGVDLRDEIRLQDVEVGLEGIALALAEEHLDRIPEGATLSGVARLDGAPAGVLHVEGDLVLYDPPVGESRLVAVGDMTVADGLAFSGFQATFDPLRVATLGALVPDLPLGGIVTLGAVLDGAVEEGLEARVLFLHEDGEERTLLEGDAWIATADPGSAWVDLAAHELSLVTAGRFVPDAHLRGGVSGRIEAEGSGRTATVVAELRTPDDGWIDAWAAVDAEGAELEYDAELALIGVNVAALTGRWSDSTSVEGDVLLRGTGTELATLTAEIEADLSDGAAERERRLRAAVTVEDGLALVDRLEALFETAEARLTGTFGLRADREGTLAYRVTVDSLQAFDVLVGEGGRVAPRPAVQAAALEVWEEALLDAARAAEVEHLATGRRPSLEIPETEPALVGIDRGALGGSVEASGQVRGNTERFDALGQISASGLLLWGQQAEELTVGHEVQGVGGTTLDASVDVVAENIFIEGFAYEELIASAELRQEEAARSGSAFISLRETDGTRIGAEATFESDEDTYVVRAEEIALELPDVTYRTPYPGTVTWTPEAVAVDDLRLETGEGALLRVDGRLPLRVESERDEGIDLRVENLEVGHLFALLQDEDGVRGRLSLHLPVHGTAARPRFEGRATLTDAWRNDVRLPDVVAELGYSEGELNASAEMEWVGETVFLAEATLPIELGLVDAPDPRFPDAPIRVEARLDDLPLSALAAFTDDVRDVVGRGWGHVTVAGTYAAPEIEGALDLDMPAARVEPLGLRIRDTAGSLRLVDDVLTVDSLVAYSGGPLRVTGEVGLERMAAPAFDLAIEADNVRIMGTRDVELWVDALLEVAGPFEAIEATGQVRTRRGVVRLADTGELAAPGPLDLEDPELFERVDPVLIAARDALIDPTPLLENLRVDMEVVIDRDVWIRAPDLNVEVFTPPGTGPLRVRMTGLRPAELSLEGTIQADRGEYEFMGRRLDLARASATFVPEAGLDPLLRLTAEHEVQLPGRQAFDIRIILDGSFAGLDTELESTAQPPLSETDLLSYLVFGRDAGSLLQQHGSALSGQASAGGPLVGQFASRATQQFATVGMQAVLRELEAETAYSLGLDVLHIKPSADTPAELFTGEFLDVLRTTEVEAGRYVTPRLFVSGQARPTFVHPGARLEYETGAGYVWSVSWRPRFLPGVPTLGEVDPQRASVLGTILFREWRF